MVKRVLSRDQLPLEYPWMLTAVSLLAADRLILMLKQVFGYTVDPWVWFGLVVGLIAQWVVTHLEIRREKACRVHLADTAASDAGSEGFPCSKSTPTGGSMTQKKPVT